MRQAVNNRGATLVAAEPYNLSVEGIRAAGPAAAAALNGGGANAVILTDGPTGGLGFISEALRGNGVGRAQFLGMQRWDTSAETLGVPSLQGGVFAAPDPAFLGAFRGRYQTAYGEAPHELAGLAFDAIAAVGALDRRGPRPGRQPVLDRAPHPERRLRRGQRPVPPDPERRRAAQPRDHRRPERPGGRDGKGGALV